MSDRPDENDKSVKDQQRDDTLYDGFRPGGSTEEQSAEQGDKGLGSQQDSDLPDDFRPGENSKETKVEEHKRPGVGDIPEADVLSKAGEKPDKGGKTRAGREFEKHGRRYPEFWGQTKGMNAETYNKNGQEILDSIINSPDTQWN